MPILMPPYTPDPGYGEGSRFGEILTTIGREVRGVIQVIRQPTTSPMPSTIRVGTPSVSANGSATTVSNQGTFGAVAMIGLLILIFVLLFMRR